MAKKTNQNPPAATTAEGKVFEAEAKKLAGELATEKAVKITAEEKVVELEGKLTEKEEAYILLKQGSISKESHETLKEENITLAGDKAILEKNLSVAEEKANDFEKKYNDLVDESAEATQSITVKEAEEVDELEPFELKDGRKFGFTKRTPKHLKVLNIVYSQAELIKNADAMQYLIIGNSHFVEQKN